MAFFIDTRGEPTAGSRMGEALGQGLGQGMQVGLQYKLSELMQQKELEREGLQNERVNQELYNIKSRANPQLVGNFYKLMVEHGGAERANRARAIAAGLPAGVPGPTEMKPEKLPKTIDANAPISELTAPESKIPQYDPGSTKDLENRRAQVIDAYNEEGDPKVKKEIYSTVKDLNKQILDQKREERETKLTNYKLESEQRDVIKKVNDDYNATLKKRPIYRIMETKAPELQSTTTLKRFLMDKFDIPPGLMLKPDAEVLEKVSQQLLRGITAEYQGAGRILQSEVENYVRSNPSLLNSPEGMQKLAKISMEFDNIAEKKWQLKNQIVKDYRSRKEPLPEDLDTQILEKAKDFEDEAFKKIQGIMNVKGVQTPQQMKAIEQSKFKVGQIVNTLPSPAEVPPGAVFKDDQGNRFRSNGQTWEQL